MERSIKNPQNSAANSPQSRFQKGMDAFTKGYLKKAHAFFYEAALGFKQKGDLLDQCDCLLRSALVCLSMGHTDQAAFYLKEAEKTAVKSDSRKLLGRVYALRGNLYHLSGKPKAARESMQKAISIAKKHGYQKLLVSVHNDLGNLFGSLQHYSMALNEYRISSSLAKKDDDSLRSAVALTNAANICIKTGDLNLKLRPEHHDTGEALENNSRNVSQKTEKKASKIKKTTSPARTRASILISRESNADTHAYETRKTREYFNKAAAFLDNARVTLQKVEKSQHKITAHINIGLAYLDLMERIPKNAVSSRARAFQELFGAVKLSRKLKNARLASYADGNLGLLRQKEGKLPQAIKLTEKAIYWATKANVPESLYRWQWQYARILSIQNRMPEAISTYQDAITTLESIRTEFSNCYGRQKAELRKESDALYLAYVDVLLKAADGLGVTDQQEILKKARETVEKRKLFELREYFNDDCLGASAIKSTNVDELIETAVVVYPIILPDRLEIIATFPSRSGKSGEKAISRHYMTRVSSKTVIKKANDFRRSLARLTSRDYLKHSKQLYDWLIRPLEQELARSQADTLVFIPDGALRNIPMGALNNGSSFLIQSYAVAVTPGLALTNPTPLHPEKMNVLAVGISSEFNELPELPGVADELTTISSMYNAEVLMDKEFSLDNFEQALQDDIYNVVHIASHGKFSDRIEESFILTVDTPMTMSDLSNFVGLYRFRDQPLELLTLSACETAAGNDQAALGMAGIAVKIGARSALATLWAVDDQAAAQLVSQFYRQLQKPGVSRATALKEAKQKLLRDSDYSHPGYWSPFILINNWL
jgi:CHAT domain-containing protein